MRWIILASSSPNSPRLRVTRKFAEDYAVVCGLGRFQGQPVMVIGQEKGNDTTSRLKRNFGMARPEGYRKAVRLMETAERFGLPVISFVGYRRRLSWH